jgi:hypothetical protein
MGENFQYPAASSEAFWPNESVGQVNGEKDGDGTAEDIVEQHRVLSSQPVAGLRVGKAEGEEDDRCADKNDVEHHPGSFGFGRTRQAKRRRPDGRHRESFLAWRVSFDLSRSDMEPNRIGIREHPGGEKIGIL